MKRRMWLWWEDISHTRTHAYEVNMLDMSHRFIIAFLHNRLANASKKKKKQHRQEEGL